MSRATFRTALKLFALTVAVGLGALGLVVHRVLRYPERAAAPGDDRAVELEVRRGMALAEVAAALEERDLIDRAAWFRLYATQRGLASRLRAGRYELRRSMTPRELLETLIRGARAPEVAVTIPEGKQLLEVCALVAAAGVADRATLEAAARDRALAHRLGLRGPTLEGYLFPDTYRFGPHTPAERALTTMVERHRAVFAELEALHPDAEASLRRLVGFGPAEMVTLASIVEKETGAPAERPRIAAVFLNRLRLPTFTPRLLQTDPTIVYGCTVLVPPSAACARFEGRIRRIHLDDRDNPYNTYTHEGLPPGPISNPGRAALEAVFAPEARAPYLYFVSRNDGTHQFSATRAEHEAAVTRYQRGGR